MRWRKAAILGVGLLGGSLGLALRQRGLAGEVTGLVRREVTAREAVELGAVTSAGLDLGETVAGADLVVLCTPIAQMAELAAGLRGRLAPGALVTDVGSAKGTVIQAVEGVVAAAGGQFVGSHPMAGSERMGVSAARPDLFHGAITVITPTPRTSPRATDAATGLWESVGSRVTTMTPERHDALVGRTSHLPHLVAAALTRCVLQPAQSGDAGRLCATGFRDTTRVASGSPEMWRDIAFGNRAAILDALKEFAVELEGLRERLAAGDVHEIEEFLKVARERRESWRQSAQCADGE